MGYTPDDRKMLTTYRGRRLLVFRAIATLESVIDEIGNETGTPKTEGPATLPELPSVLLRNEMKNQAMVLLRTILIHNDGHMGPSKLQPF